MNMAYKTHKRAILMFQDGRYYEGIGFGAIEKIIGEMTFTTIPGSGYVETLTDSANKDQILLFTYPSIGNYGVPQWDRDEHGLFKHFESDSIKVKGLIVNEYCNNPSHYESVKSLEEWLIEEKIPGIQWLDTRMLTQELVNEGNKIALLTVFNSNDRPNLEELNQELQEIGGLDSKNLVCTVSNKKIKKITPTEPMGTVVIYDLGIKNSLIRALLSRNLEVLLVPYLFNYEQIMELNPNGVLLSNGPGNPMVLKDTIAMARDLISNSIPTLGIGLGHMIIGLASKYDCYKMIAQHHGGRTIVENETDHCYITSQNHGYCLKPIEKGEFRELYHDKDDKSNDGLIHESKPILSVSFNPEGAPGSFDMKDIIFDQFLNFMGV